MKSLPLIAATLAAILTLAGQPSSAQSFTGPSFGIEVAREDLGSTDGTVTTLVAGWDFAVAEDWRVGAGIRLAVADIEESRTEAVGTNFQDVAVAIENRRGITARVGRTLGDQWMAYAELGYEQYDVEAQRVLRAPFCVPPTACVISRTNGSFDESMTSLGLGVEWAATEQARLRASASRGESDAFDSNRFAISAVWQF